jgi:transcription elongation factor GreB
MSKAFTKENDDADDGAPPDASAPALPVGAKNYMTPEGFAAMQSELKQLSRNERPKVVETVSWAAGNGDRSENGDYIYGKQRLRQIDYRIRYLTKRLEIAEVVDPAMQPNRDQVFFGASVCFANAKGVEKTITIVGVDETDSGASRVSWVSPIARALLKAHEGDTVELRTPSGPEPIEVVSISYPDKTGLDKAG